MSKFEGNKKFKALFARMSKADRSLNEPKFYELLNEAHQQELREIVKEIEKYQNASKKALKGKGSDDFKKYHDTAIMIHGTDIEIIKTYMEEE